MEYIAVGLAGFLGAIARYWASLTIRRLPGAEGFPWATLAINVSGSFLIGFAFAFMSARADLDPRLRTAVAVGFIGSYTTFSTFSFETMEMLNRGAWVAGLANIGASITICLAAVYAGLAAGRLVSPGGSF